MISFREPDDEIVVTTGSLSVPTVENVKCEGVLVWF